MNCPTCGQTLPDPSAIRHITERELEILSAWWLLHSVRSVARFFGLSEQTIKNQLYRARHRNDVQTSAALAQMFMERLLPMDVLISNVTKHGRAAA